MFCCILWACIPFTNTLTEIKLQNLKPLIHEIILDLHHVFQNCLKNMEVDIQDTAIFFFFSPLHNSVL